jgi:hypothetical protein
MPIAIIIIIYTRSKFVAYNYLKELSTIFIVIKIKARRIYFLCTIVVNSLCKSKNN